MKINCSGKLIDLREPKIMGILNMTFDSFFEGSRLNNVDEALKKAELLLIQGADFLDLGGMSTRLGSSEITLDEELKRVVPTVEAIMKEFPEAIISVDTYRSKVAKHSVEAGASIINDISAGVLDDKLFETVAELNVPYILMHMQGSPKNMQQNPHYEDHYEDVVLEVNEFLSEKIQALRSLGVNDIILDPGFGVGFGKALHHNYELMDKMDLIGFGEYPILVGISRKSMITQLLNISAKEALNGTSVLNLISLQKGANILRVHDVKEAKEVVQIWEQFQ